MKRIRFSFFSQPLLTQGWELAITDEETLQVYARQAGFTTQKDAHLAAEALLSAMQSIGAELATRGEWEEAPRD